MGISASPAGDATVPTWRAFVKDRRDDGSAYVVFDDGTTEYAQWLSSDGTLASLRAAARSWIADKNRRVETKSEIQPGMELDLSDDPAPDPPPADQQRRMDFDVADARLAVLLGDVTKGYLAQDDKSVAQARSTAVALYDVSYRDVS
jgi:hypothetical protein